MKPTPREIFIGLIVVVVAFWAYTLHERNVGKLALQLHAADSVSKVRLVEQAAAHDSAVDAKHLADSLVGNAKREAKKDAKTEAHTDSALTASAGERQRAVALLADSAATLAAVRAELTRLAQSSRQDSASFADERIQHQRTTALLLQALKGDSVALGASLKAENAAIARAVASEHQTALLKASRPSAVGTILRTASYVAIGYGVAKILR